MTYATRPQDAVYVAKSKRATLFAGRRQEMARGAPALSIRVSLGPAWRLSVLDPGQRLRTRQLSPLSTSTGAAACHCSQTGTLLYG
jgi:hypothetical protein